MANRLVFKGIKEITFKSIAQYNADNGTKYYIFNPLNITDFKCKEGMLNGNLVYLLEYIQCMWGNDEIYEYVITDKSLLDNLDISKFGELQTAQYGDIMIKFTYHKGLFSRYFYNAIITINNTIYYLFIKTINGTKFKQIIENFINDSLNH